MGTRTRTHTCTRTHTFQHNTHPHHNTTQHNTHTTHLAVQPCASNWVAARFSNPQTRRANLRPSRPSLPPLPNPARHTPWPPSQTPPCPPPAAAPTLQVGTEGAKAVLGAVPVARPPGLKPLWLRLEWNQVDAAELTRFIAQVGAQPRNLEHASMILLPGRQGFLAAEPLAGPLLIDLGSAGAGQEMRRPGWLRAGWRVAPAWLPARLCASHPSSASRSPPCHTPASHNGFPQTTPPLSRAAWWLPSVSCITPAISLSCTHPSHPLRNPCRGVTPSSSS
jgi:hypothetical protein